MKWLLRIWPEQQRLRKAIAGLLAMIFAVWIDHAYSALHQQWVPLLTFATMSLMVQCNLRQLLERLFVLLSVVLLVGWLLTVTQSFAVLLSLLLVGCLVTTIVQRFLSAHEQVVALPFVVIMVASVFVLPMPVPVSLLALMHDVVLGAMLGVLARIVLLPARSDVDFRQGVIPLLQAYDAYLGAIVALMYPAEGESQVDACKLRVETLLQSQGTPFPVWVYDMGFNPALQQGHRHFLMRVEQLGQVLFALHHVAQRTLDPTLLAPFQEPMLHFVTKTRELLRLFEERLALAPVQNPLVPYHTDLLQLENIYREVVAVPLELLDTTPDALDIAACLYDLKDIHKLMLTLAESLREC